MGLLRVLALAVLGAALAGCAGAEPARRTAWLSPLQGPSGPDAVHLHVALLERPIHDRYLNGELWALADEQAVGLEKRALLEENGFRIGQVGGLTPAGLHDLLAAERNHHREPRCVQTRAGKPTTLPLGPPRAECRAEVRRPQGEPVRVELDRAECSLVVVPSLAANGRTRLRFTPCVRHGEATPQPRAAPDRSGILLQSEKPSEEFTDLSWEVELAPNEFVVIGARADRPGTLGRECFVRADEARPVQRLLVIRTGRAAEASAGPRGAKADAAFGRSPPLALQAALDTTPRR